MSNFKFKIHLWWLVPLLIVDAVIFWYWRKHYFSSSSREICNGALVADAGGHEKRLKLSFCYPTDRQLDRWNSEAFQPTASGRPESALYGSVRTARIGRKLLPSFHEGIDIAPIERDRAGNPRDVVMAAAVGEVAYVNRYSGNSNYGKYVVLLHGDGPGRVYTLYAHLSAVGPGIIKGRRVEQGNVLGIMGSTSTDRISPANGHLHFETGLMLNSRFDRWFKRQKLTPDHGLFNGWNLIGIDPLAVYERQEEDGDGYELSAHLSAMPRAFEIVLKTPRQLDFFRRYPALWQGAEFSGGVMVLACSENGLPLSGRCASGNETAGLGRRTYIIRGVDGSVLGRNGCRLVLSENGQWRLGAEGEKWLSILMF